LERVPGVAKVDIVGAPPNEIEVAIDPERLGAHGISLNELNTRLRTVNFSLSAGQIEAGQQRLRVQPVGEMANLDQLRDLVINQSGLRLRDIADVRLKPQRMNYGRRLDGQPAVGLEIFKERNANLVEVSTAALAEIDRVRERADLSHIQVKVVENL